MNEIVNTFSMAGDTFMPEIHLKLPGFTYSASSFIQNKKRIIRFMQSENTNFI